MNGPKRDGLFCIYFSRALCTEQACISFSHEADKLSIFFVIEVIAFIQEPVTIECFMLLSSAAFTISLAVTLAFRKRNVVCDRGNVRY